MLALIRSLEQNEVIQVYFDYVKPIFRMLDINVHVAPFNMHSLPFNILCHIVAKCIVYAWLGTIDNLTSPSRS